MIPDESEQNPPNGDRLPDDNLYGEFIEGGYTIKAYYGNNHMIVVAYNADGVEVDRIDAPRWTYEPRFGLDVQDAAALEEATDELIARLPDVL